MNAAGFLKARSNPLLCIYSYCGLDSVSPQASLTEILAFISFGP